MTKGYFHHEPFQQIQDQVNDLVAKGMPQFKATEKIVPNTSDEERAQWVQRVSEQQLESMKEYYQKK